MKPIKNGRHFGNAQFITMTVADTLGGSRSDTAKSEQKIRNWAKTVD